MNFDLHEARCFIDEVVKSAPDTRSGMYHLLDFCEKLSPNLAWSSIRNLDFESDIENLRIWLVRVLSAEPPSKKSLPFGLASSIRFLRMGRSVVACIFRAQQFMTQRIGQEIGQYGERIPISLKENTLTL